MVVKLDSARITVEVDVRRATAEIREVETALQKARRRRRGVTRRVDPTGPARVAGRNLRAATTVGAAAAVGGGLRRAVGLAATLGGVIGAAQAIRAAPAILPEILPEEVLEQRLIPGEIEIGLRLVGQSEFADLVRQVSTVRGLIDGLRRGLAEVESTVVTVADSVRLGADLLAEGKFVEGGFKLNAELTKALSLFLKGERISTDLSIPEDIANTFNAVSSYNRAKSLHKQYAKRSQASEWIDNQREALRAGGGGANR